MSRESRVNRLMRKGDFITLINLFHLVERDEDPRMRELVVSALRELGAAGNSGAKEFVRSHDRRLDRARQRVERGQEPRRKRATAPRPRISYSCSNCGKPLEKIGIPSEIQALRQYDSVIDVGSGGVPEMVKRDPFVYRGFVCPKCRKAFCPTCSNMQGEICPSCGEWTLMPAYRPLLKEYATKTNRDA